MAVPKKRHFARWTLTVSLVALLLIAILVSTSRKTEPTYVHVVHANYEDLTRTVSTTGLVRPVDVFQARANFPGIVDKLYVSLGDQVKAGQMLVRMKDPYASSRVATANANLKSAEVGEQNIRRNGSADERITLEGDLEHAQAAKTRAQHTLEDLKLLQAKGAASPAEVDAAQQRLDDATTTLQTLQARSFGRFSAADRTSAAARVQDARTALEAAQIAYDNANITSPISGTVYSIPVNLYDFVPMGADLLDVANLKQVQIRAFFDEPEMGGLTVGQPVRILWDGKPNREWHGHIKQAPVAAMVMGPRSVGEVTISADDANGELLPNITVTVIVTVQRASHVLSIPREALHTQGSNHFVYRVVNDRLVRTPVQVGIVNLSRAEIRSGISAQDTIALNATNRYELADNLPARIVQ